ncbi:MAG: HAD hydrolase-like protein [Microgenomates group bacterium]
MINFSALNWCIKDVETVLFDKDGTIQDLHIYWGEIIKMRSSAFVKDYKLNSQFFNKICLWMGYDLSKQKLLEFGPVGILSREEIIDILFRKLKNNNITISKIEIQNLFEQVHKDFLNKMDNYVVILPGIKNLMKKLKSRNIKIAIVTSDSVVNAKKCMSLLKLNSYIDAYIGREQSVLPKASGVHVKIALDMLGSTADKSICLGDAPMDLIMAAKGGLKAGIGVTLGQTSFQELSKYSNYIIHSYDELNIR